MRTWFDKSIEWMFIGIAIWSVVGAVQVMIDLAKL